MARLTWTWPLIKREALALAMAVMLAACALAMSGATMPIRGAAADLSPQVVLDWNLNAVPAVRGAAPAKLQAEGLVYTAYAQAAVYDAVTKIAGR